MLPARLVQATRRTHDCTRHGTTNLFTAIDVATDHVVSKCYARDHAVGFCRFLDRIGEAMPSDLDVHSIMDNYATYKAQLIRSWLIKRPRWHVHLTPTNASWLNQVELFFALVTEEQIRRGVHQSVAHLKAAITGFIDQHNTAPKPFRWTKPASDILANVERFYICNARTKATT